MPTLMITGANRGLGLEFTKQYLADGWKVVATCRDPQLADALHQLYTLYPDHLLIYRLDVANFTQIEQLAAELTGMPIDILINNAGVYPMGKETFGQVDYQAWAETFRINSMAPLKMTEAFIDLLSLGQMKKVINITSKMGSIDDNTSGHHYLYRSSKTALNMVTKSMALDLAPKGITVIVMHPGWVQTDMGGSNAPTTIPQSITGMRKVIDRLTLADGGKFYAFDGKEIPW
jgi:NAD(P)-dependent dehydrogenase (short-subunit alcohol dehydrogenase family)